MFSLTIVLVFFDIFIAEATFDGLSSMITTSAAFIAASLPSAPIAIPTSAHISTGASFMPSPTKASVRLPITSTITASASLKYDFEKRKLSSQRYEIRKNLHCWDLAFQFKYSSDYDFAGLVTLELVRYPDIRIYFGYE